MKELYIITGASGSGKSTIKTLVQEILGTAYTTHEFDAKGVPANADTPWRQQRSEEWLAELADESTVSCLFGQVVLAELFACPSAKRFTQIHACLLDVSDAERAKRLAQRGEHDVSPHMFAWASWLREHHNDPQWRPQVITDHVWQGLELQRWQALTSWVGTVNTNYIETTHMTPEEVALQVAKLIRAGNSNH